MLSKDRTVPFGCLTSCTVLLLSVVTCVQVRAEPARVTAVVDPRVELMSVIFHLAGNSEYNQCKSKRFMQNLNAHFSEYRNHPAVEMAANLRKKRGVSYDAVMSMAAHIKDINDCAELVPFSTGRLTAEPRPDALDGRWQIDEAREFLSKCRDFVRDTNFTGFLLKNKPMYDIATQRLQYLVDSQARLEWFDKFFGAKSDKQFNLVVSILNGGSCYGVRLQTKEQTQIYCILGAWNIDWFGWGNPTFNTGMVSTIVHEFCHSYCNPLVDKYMDRLKPFAEKLYAKAEAQMRNQAYGSWQTLMYESLVRACEVRYACANNGPQYGQRVAQYQVSRGFAWTPQLAELLAEYEKQRDKYPNLDSFMPRVVEFFEAYSDTHG